jgi:hypothetical protein
MAAQIKSPYLYGDNRLGDVIAAIQVMGSYDYYKNWILKGGLRESAETKAKPSIGRKFF